MLLILAACSSIDLDSVASDVGCDDETSDVIAESTLQACYDACSLFWTPEDFCYNMWLAQSPPVEIEVCYGDCERATRPLSGYEGATMQEIWPGAVSGYLRSYGDCTEAERRAGSTPCHNEDACYPAG